MNNLKERLKQGETIIFNNELFCTENQSDDFREAYLEFINKDKYNWVNGYKIYFNGGYYSYKTFTSFKRKLDQLINDFNLTYNEIETESNK